MNVKRFEFKVIHHPYWCLLWRKLFDSISCFFHSFRN